MPLAYKTKRHPGKGSKKMSVIAAGFLAGACDDEFMQWKWRLYDERVNRELQARLPRREGMAAA
jgi:hypothetical protein